MSGMRRKDIFFTFLLVYIVPNIFDWTAVVAAKSFLTAQKFPTVFEDLSFTERMEILADDYNDLGAIFDENGVCISGCAYQGITMEDDLKRMERQTEVALEQLKKEGHISEDGNLIRQENQPVQMVQSVQSIQNTSQNTSNQADMQNYNDVYSVAESIVVSPVGASFCVVRKSDIPVGQKKPLGEPLDGKARISSKFGPRINPVTKKRQNHNGVDLAVPMGRNIYSTADGYVKSAFTDRTCGKGVKITHIDGYETVYCHMSEHAVKTGDSVLAGCLIGKVGSTGRSTGPHLHYSVRLNGTAINPVQLMGR